MKVLSIEQMNKLKELGVDVSNASARVGQMLFYHGDSWYGIDSYNLTLLNDDDDDTSCFEEEYKAFSLQDIIELLPGKLIYEESNLYLTFENIDNEYGFCYVACDFEVRIYFNNRDILQAAYNMLLWVIENGYLKTK